MLKIYTLDNSIEWDNVVKSFSNYDVYYLSGYVLPFVEHGDGEPLLFYFENSEFRALNVVMKRDISKLEKFSSYIQPNTTFDFASPYGYGGWIFDGEGNCDDLFKVYNDWCVRHGIVSEFVRLHPILNNFKLLTANYEVLFLGNTVSMDLSSEEIIWNNLSSKKRNIIRRAEKFGIKIDYRKDEEIYDIFRGIYNETMDRDRAEQYYYFSKKFYLTLRESLYDNAYVFFAKNDVDEIIAASIILACNDKLTYHLSGAQTAYRPYAPTDLLLYKVALWGAKNGYKTLHLGGGVGAKDDGLFHFKRGFYRGDLKEYYIGKKIFDLQKYNILAEINGVDSGFFPVYRSEV